MKFKRINSNSQIRDNSMALTETGLNFEIENIGVVRRKCGNLRYYVNQLLTISVVWNIPL